MTPSTSKPYKKQEDKNRFNSFKPPLSNYAVTLVEHS